MKVFFNSSLPRSGSTLLQNVLAQNPRFYCSPTSAVLDLLYAARQNFTSMDEFKLQDGQLMKQGWLGFCLGGLRGFYQGITDKPCVVDKSRGWVRYASWLYQFMPEAKIICCVRDLRSIMASMEKLHRKNMHLADPADKPAQMAMVNIKARVQHWLNNPPVGLALEGLRDAFHKGDAQRFHFIVYEDFMVHPHETMESLYRYLEEKPFKHDFEHIEQVVNERDSIHGVYGDHNIASSLRENSEHWRSFIGESVGKHIVQSYGWFYRQFYPAQLHEETTNHLVTDRTLVTSAVR